MDDFRTADSVLKAMESWARERQSVSPHTWVDASQALNALSGEETDRLFEFQQIVAKKKVEFIEKGDSVAMAKAKVEADDCYKDMKKQEAKCARITEAIRISKIQARLVDDTFKNQ